MPAREKTATGSDAAAVLMPAGIKKRSVPIWLARDGRWIREAALSSAQKAWVEAQGVKGTGRKHLLLPGPEGEIPDTLPLLWIEILSKDDRMMDVWEKTRNAIACGAPYVWVIDPDSLESELWTSSGKVAVADRTLRLPDSPILIPLGDVLDE